MCPLTAIYQGRRLYVPIDMPNPTHSLQGLMLYTCVCGGGGGDCPNDLLSSCPTMQTVAADGGSVVHFANKDVKSLGASGRVDYYYAEVG